MPLGNFTLLGVVSERKLKVSKFHVSNFFSPFIKFNKLFCKKVSKY